MAALLVSEVNLGASFLNWLAPCRRLGLSFLLGGPLRRYLQKNSSSAPPKAAKDLSSALLAAR